MSVSTRWLVPLLLAGLLAAPSAGADDGGPAWRRLPDGLSIRRLREGAVAPGSPPALLVRLDPALHRLRMHGEPAGEGWTPLRAEARPRALAVLNGGYFDERGRPLGWLVCDGREQSALRPAGWAAFVIDGAGRARVVPAREAARLDSVAQAVQAGPRLVVAGAPNPLKPQVAVRSFVGVDARGRIVLGTTSPFPAEANALARALAASEEAGGAGLVDALNLDGGGSAQLWIRGAADDGSDVALPGLSPVPDLLVVEATTP